MTPLVRNRMIGFAIAATIFVFDQATKWLVAGPLGLERQGDQLVLLPFFALTRTHNVGVSLGMFPAQSDEMIFALIGVTGLIALAVAVWILRETRLGDIASLGLVLGGAMGNILDRINHGYVLDFADLHFGDFRPFLVFNVADAAITIGVLIILARSLFMREKPAPTQSPTLTTKAADNAAETD